MLVFKLLHIEVQFFGLDWYIDFRGLKTWKAGSRVISGRSCFMWFYRIVLSKNQGLTANNS
jgi:hypothetical protein